MSPSLVAKEIEATKVIFDLLVDLHGVASELLKSTQFHQCDSSSFMSY